MAFFGKKPTNEADAWVAKESPPVPASASEAATAPVVTTDAEGSRLIVGPNIRLTGSEISDCDTVIIEGRVEAVVDGRVMQIAETGTFSGTVAIDIAEIRGRFQGELTVRKRLTVCGTGKVQGKIRYGMLVVEEGGELSGDVDSLNPPQPPVAGKWSTTKENRPAQSGTQSGTRSASTSVQPAATDTAVTTPA